MTARKAVFVVDKRIDSPEISTQSGGVGAFSKINAKQNSAHCNWGLTILLSEVNVRFIVLLSLIDRTQGRVRGGKAG